MRYAILLIPLIALLALACGDEGDRVVAPTATQTAPEPTPPRAATPEVAAETLAFLRDGDIWLTGADGSGERSLNLSAVQSFSWVSPDELDVVTDGDEPGHLLVNLEGNVRELPFPAGGSWSRDGTLYVAPVDQEIVVSDRDGGEVARLEVRPPPFGEPPKEQECGEADPLVFGRPVLSPDAERVLVAVECSLRAGVTGNLLASVFEVSLDGTLNRATPLSVNLDLLRGPRFSPDGAHIAQLDSWDNGACFQPWWLTVAEADGADGQELAIDELEALRSQEPAPEILGGVIGFDWSPDGDAVVASIDIQRCQDQGVEQVLSGLYMLQVDGSSEERLDEQRTHSPVWSPSGQLIAYVVGEYFGEPSEPPAVRVLDVATRKVVDIADGSQPAWQPQP